MKNFKSILTAGSLIMVCGTANAALVAGWDFQTTTNGGTAVTVQDSAQAKLFTANFGSGALYLDGTNYSSNWSVSSTSAVARELNAFNGTTQNASANGFSTTTTSPACLAFVGAGVSGSGNYTANGKSGVFKISMANYKDLSISLATTRTGSGFTSMAWEVSKNGTSWTSAGTLSSGTTAGTITSSFSTLTLSTITALDNATTAYVRFTLTGATAQSGNLKIDNVAFNATLVPAPGAAALIGLAGLITTRRRK